MKRFVLSLVLALTSASAFAANPCAGGAQNHRPNALYHSVESMTCAQAQAAVRAIHPPHNSQLGEYFLCKNNQAKAPIFVAFDQDSEFCGEDEGVPLYERTSDKRACKLGYRCEGDSNGD
jgi:hypothetical protein